MNNKEIIVKIAQTEEELRQIHQLNYQTFVEEIEQHQPNESKELVDKFNQENTYYIAKKSDEIIGMLCLRDKRPFSLDKKVDNLNSILPKHSNIVEIRLLSVKKEYRNSGVLVMLLSSIRDSNPEKSYDLAIISGIINQQKLYEHIGFQKMGEPVGKEVKFQPMYITAKRFVKYIDQLNGQKNKKINFLPGPVSIAKNVKKAFHKKPISHRATPFINLFEDTKKRLLSLTSANHVEIITGSGTATNDVVCGQISLLNQKGLILSNGEFGERLFKHATNFNVEYSSIKKEWGTSFSIEEIEESLKKTGAKWIWMVHNETSTGMLNNLEKIAKLCSKINVKVCVDAISSFGTEKIDFSNIYLASAVSSKGMASFAGLGIIFYNHELLPQTLPSSINLYLFSKANGIPNTISSNMVLALNKSLKNFSDIDERINHIKELSEKTYNLLNSKGIKTLVSQENASKSTITLVLDKSLSSLEIGNKLKKHGIIVSYESGYLIEKNWIQICFMGSNLTFKKVEKFVSYLAK